MKHNPIQEIGTCSLCGEPYAHFGNNPEPIKDLYERCCDRCNHELVLPARIYPVLLRYSIAKAIYESLNHAPRLQEILGNAMEELNGKLGTWEEAKAQREAAFAALEKLNQEKP